MVVTAKMPPEGGKFLLLLRLLGVFALLIRNAAAGLAGALAGGLAFAAAAVLRAFAKGFFIQSNDVFHFLILRKRF